MSTESRSLLGLLAEHPAQAGDTIVFAQGRTTTRAELDELVHAIATRLVESGCEGETVAVSLPNTAATVAAWFAVWSTGGAVAPVNPRAPASEAQRLMELAGVTFTLTEASSAADPILFDEPVVGGRIGQRDGKPSPAAQALVQFTSGTTGRPKAIPLEHDTILALLDPVIASLRQRGPARRAPMPNLIPMSLSLWAGIYNVLFAFRVGAPVVLMERFDAVEFARLVRQFSIKSSVLPPAALTMLLEERSIETLAPLRYVRSVSAPLSPAHARRFHERFAVAVLNGYGQTELGGEAVGWSAEDWRRFGQSKLGSVGRPHANMQVRIRDGSSAVPTGELGEVEIRSNVGPPTGAEGLEGRLTADGWLRTGDLGRFDEDGFLWIEGRVSAMINRGGLKVFPDEVEEVLRGFADVADVSVVGVPDERLGEVPLAFVVPRRADRAVDLDALRAFAKERLVAYKVPATFRTIDQLPRNEMGKVLRHVLAGIAAET